MRVVTTYVSPAEPQRLRFRKRRFDLSRKTEDVEMPLLDWLQKPEQLLRLVKRVG